MMMLLRPVFRPGMPRKPVLSRSLARAAWGAALLLLAAPWAIAQTTFNYTVGVQTYTVPAGAGGVTIQANGAGGGSGGNDANGWGGAGGAGARATGTYYAAPGTVLNIYVGQGGRAGNTSQGSFTCANAAGAGGLAGGAAGFAGGSGGQAGCSGWSGGGGGGGGCPGGAGGAELVDSSGANNTLQARGGSSCSDTAEVTAFSVTTAGAAGGASITGTAPQSGNNGTNGTVVITPINPTRNLSKSQPSPALALNRDSVYTLTVTATTATPFFTATVTDRLPANLTYVSGAGTGWTCSLSGTLVTCNYSSTTEAATASVDITVRPTSTVAVTNRASVGAVGNAAPPTAGNCTALNAPNAGCAAPVTNTPTNAILNLVKSAPSPALKVGSNSAYTLTLTNTGTTASTTARITDQLPANLTYVSGAGTGWTCSTAASGGGTLVTCDYTGSIATGGGTAVVVITVTPTSTASVTNYASVDRTGGTNTPTPATCTAANTPTAGCAAPVTSTPTSVILGLVKSAPSPALQVFSNSAYTLTVTNSGTAATATARILDQLPANLTYVSGTGTGWSCSAAAGGGALVTCNYSGNITAGGGTSAVVITVTATSNATTTNYASVDPTGGTAPPTPTSCTAANTPSAGCAAPVTSIAGRGIAGTVYADVNHNSSLEASESGTGVTPLFVKLVPLSGGVCPGPAVAAAPVTPSTGAYSLSSVAEGNYCLVLNGNGTLSDVAPAYPAGWIGTENPTGVIQLTVGAAPPSPKNFGLYNGSTLSGNVFADNGAGPTTANNGVKGSAEPGLAGITVNAMQGATTLDSEPTASDGSFILWVPASASGTVVITPVLPAGYIATGGSAGNTGGTYTRPSVSYTAGSGLARTGINFGMVAPNVLSPNGTQTAQPGTIVFYAHTYKAGTGGQVSFSIAGTATPASPAWNQVLYQDSNCDAVLGASEPQVTAAITVTAGQTVCLIVKQFVPAGAGQGAQNSITLSAAFTYTNAAPALAVSTLVATDITTVGQAGDVSLAKLVKNVTQSLPTGISVNASPGDTLEYILTATNNGTQALSTLFVSDSTTAFTGFVSAACPGTLPAGITGCTVTTQPGVGTQGALKWTFTGSLASGAQLVVTYRVKVDQ